MNFRSLRSFSPALVPLFLAAATADCGFHDSNVGSAQLSSGSEGGSGGAGGFASCQDLEGGPYLGEAIDCDSEEGVAVAMSVTCEDWLAQCAAAAKAHGGNVLCRYNFQEIGAVETTPGACDDVFGGDGGTGGTGGSGAGGAGGEGNHAICISLPGPGRAELYDCDQGAIVSTDESAMCADWFTFCTNFIENERINGICYFETVEIGRHEATPGACGGAGGAGGAGAGGGGCKGAEGPGFGEAIDCKGGDELFYLEGTCQSSLDQCATHAANNPGQTFTCVWNGQTIFTQEAVPGLCGGDGPCAGQFGLGAGTATECGSGTPVFGNGSISCADFLTLCQSNGENAAFPSFACVWNDVTIFEHELAPGTCGGDGSGGSGGTQGSAGQGGGTQGSAGAGTQGSSGGTQGSGG